jgi:hypothetical protein
VMMLAYFGLTLLSLTYMIMLAVVVLTMSTEVRVLIYLYFAVATAFVVWPLHGFLAWWALITITPLVTVGIGLLGELWCAFRDRHDVEPELESPAPKKTSTRFKDYEHAWDHIGCRYPALIVCEATQVKKMAVLMYFGWSLIEVIEYDHSFRVQLQRGKEFKEVVAVKPEHTAVVVKEDLVESSPV